LKNHLHNKGKKEPEPRHQKTQQTRILLLIKKLALKKIFLSQNWRILT